MDKQQHSDQPFIVNGQLRANNFGRRKTFFEKKWQQPTKKYTNKLPKKIIIKQKWRRRRKKKHGRGDEWKKKQSKI